MTLEHVILILYYVGLFSIPTIALSVIAYRARKRRQAIKSLGRALELSFLARIPRSELAPFCDFPLFWRAQKPEIGEGWNGVQGTFEGQQLFVMDYRFTGHFNLGEYRDVLRRVMVSVIIFPGGARGLPNFRLAPRDELWNDWYLGGGEFRRVFLSRGTNRTFTQTYQLLAPVVDSLSSDFTVEDLFTPARQAYFALGEDWTVESWDGHLLVYREAMVHEPERLPDMMLKAIDICRELHEVSDREAFPNRSPQRLSQQESQNVFVQRRTSILREDSERYGPA